MATLKRHVVVFPIAAQGHITPMMQLSRRLALQGFIVTFAAADFIISRMVSSQKQSGIPLPHEEGLDIRLAGISYSSFEGADIVDINAIDAAEQPFTELVEKINQDTDSRLCCIISDLFNSYTQDLADRLGVPRVAFLTPSACSILLYMQASLLKEKGLAPVSPDDGDINQLVTCVPSIHPFPRKALPVFLARDVSLEKVSRSVKMVSRASWLLLNTFQELEAPVLEALSGMVRTAAIGPLMPVSGNQTGYGTGIWPEDITCLSWLDAQQPLSVLYISFGSIAKLSGRQLKEFALGVEASLQPFLWVVRTDSGCDEDDRRFLDEFAARTKVGCFTAWAPQLKVLSHNSVGGFLTHCGWNSTLESIRAGVPMLCWPDFFEQELNAIYVTEVWKVGYKLKRDADGVVSRVEMKRAIEELMKKKSKAREAIWKMKEAARRSVEPEGSSFQSLDLFFKFI